MIVQVLKHWHGGETGWDGLLTDDAKAKLEKGVDAIGDKLPEGADRPKLGTLQQKYLANREHAIASDAALQSATSGRGYIQFLGAQAVGRLGEDEEHYQIQFDDLPDHIQEKSKSMKFRSAVINIKTGETRLEVAWGDSRPSLWKCVDGGGDQWGSDLKLFYKFGVRGSEKYDPPHRTVRNRERAISKSGGTFVKSEFSVTLGYLRAPWGSESNYQLITGVADEIKRNFTYNLKLFKDYFYERISLAQNGGKLSAEFGSDEHRLATWQGIFEDRVVVGLGEAFATNRWKSWTDRMEWYFPSLDILLFFVIYVLTTRGICKNLGQDFPGLLGISRWAVASGLQLPSDATEFDIKSLKEASKALEAKRSRGSSSLLVVGESLSNMLTRRLGYSTMRIPQVLEVKLMRDICQCKTQEGCRDWHVEHACGNPQRKEVSELFAFAEDYKFLAPAMFLMPSEVSGKDALREDTVVAKYSWDLMRSCVVEEIRTAGFYMDRPPYRLADSKTIGL